MKALELISGFDVGGAERLLGNRLTCWRRQGLSVEASILFLKGRGALAREYDGSAKIGRYCGTKHAMAAAANADVIHAHLLHAIVLGCLLGAILRKPVVVTLHNIYYRRDWRDRLIFLLLRSLVALQGRRAVVIGISRAVTEFARHNISSRDSSTLCIENGIERTRPMQPELIRRGLGLAPAAKLAILVGRLEPQKRPQWAIDALRSFSDEQWHVCFVGEGALRRELETLAHARGVANRVHFVGAVSNVADYYAAADLLLLPSLFEGFGLVVVEALSAGLPVVASNLEGPAEIMVPGVDGELFDPRQPAEFASAWQRAALRTQAYAEHHEDRRRRMSKYSIERYSQRIADLYGSIIAWEVHESTRCI